MIQDVTTKHFPNVPKAFMLQSYSLCAAIRPFLLRIELVSLTELYANDWKQQGLYGSNQSDDSAPNGSQTFLSHVKIDIVLFDYS